MNTSHVPATADASLAALRLRAVVLALLVNAVPLAGILWFDWSAANVLVLYWFENLAIAVFTTTRLLVHRALTRKRGYWRIRTTSAEINGKPVRAGPIGEYALAAFGFTLGHGVFVGVILMIFAQNYPDQPLWHVTPQQVGRGALIVIAMLGAEMLADLATIRTRSFAAMKAFANARLGRVIVLHLAIIFGMVAMAVSHSPFGVVFVLIGLKTLGDLGGALARTSAARADAVPSPWMLKAADRMAPEKGGAAGLVKQLNADAERERREAIEDEEVMPADA